MNSRKVSTMTPEIKKLVENSKAPEAIARLFDRIAERLGEPLEFKRDESPEEAREKADEKGGADGR